MVLILYHRRGCYRLLAMDDTPSNLVSACDNIRGLNVIKEHMSSPLAPIVHHRHLASTRLKRLPWEYVTTVSIEKLSECMRTLHGKMSALDNLSLDHRCPFACVSQCGECGSLCLVPFALYPYSVHRATCLRYIRVNARHRLSLTITKSGGVAAIVRE